MSEIIYTGEAPKAEVSAVFCSTMEELFREDSKVIYIDADLMGSLKTKALWENHPENVINTGIQEANMIGLACGLNLTGYKPYVHSFTPFASRRVFDQVFLSVGYAGKSVRIIGSDAGIMATYNGGTHMCFEDTAMMCTIPGACIVDVSDAAVFSAMLKQTKDRPGVTYFRTARRGLPDVYSADTKFEIGKGKMIFDGDDVTIVASGIMVGTAIQAHAILKEKGINARIIDPITVKPLDKELIIDSAKKTGAVVVAENHSIHGGLCSEVCTLLCENYPVPVRMVAINDRFGQVGNEQYLRQEYGLTSENIVEKALEVLKKKG